MAIPTAADLLAERFLRPPKTARGIYLDRRPGHADVRMRFVWATPSRWVWMHLGEPAAGALTDGTTNVIVQDGAAAVVTTSGEVVTSHRLGNLFRPRNYDFSDAVSGPVTAGTAVGRQAWTFRAEPTTPGKSAVEVAFDTGSGVILFLRTDDSYLGFEELELDEDIPADTFRWSGPVEPRPVGTALVIPEVGGTHSVLWEVSVRGRPVFHHDGPSGVTKDEAIAWGEERAARTYLRGDRTRAYAAASGSLVTQEDVGVGPEPAPEGGR
jgi:hypothetical protein